MGARSDKEEKACKLALQAVHSDTLSKSTVDAITGKLSVRLEMCHRDYNKPLEIIWCTTPSHNRLDYLLNRSGYNHTDNPASKAVFKRHMKMAKESLIFQHKPCRLSYKKALRLYKGKKLTDYKARIVAEIEKYGIPSVSQRYGNENKYRLNYELILLHLRSKMNISGKSDYKFIMLNLEISVRKEISRIADEITISKACALFNINRTTLYRWREGNFKSCSGRKKKGGGAH